MPSSSFRLSACRQPTLLPLPISSPNLGQTCPSAIMKKRCAFDARVVTERGSLVTPSGIAPSNTLSMPRTGLSSGSLRHATAINFTHNVATNDAKCDARLEPLADNHNAFVPLASPTCSVNTLATTSTALLLRNRHRSKP